MFNRRPYTEFLTLPPPFEADRRPARYGGNRAVPRVDRTPRGRFRTIA